MKKIILFVCLLISSKLVLAQDFSAYQKKWIIQGADTMPYRLLLPQSFDASKTYPVIFFLHGSGERGNDNKLQLVHGADLFLREDVRKNYPAIIVFPQCSKGGYWANNIRAIDSTARERFMYLTGGEATRDMHMLELLVAYILENYPADKDHVYVGGLSMGGMGTFELVRRMPGIFAAAFPICGGANPVTAPLLKKTAWWIFHGAKDDVVFPAYSEKMYNALKKENANVRFTLYPEANHNSWDATFAEPGLLSWLFAQHR